MPKDHTHNSKLADNEPDWGKVDKTRLPRAAFADPGEADKKSTWGYPHHWVKGGKQLDKNGVYADGVMYLHRGGLAAGRSAAAGGRSGEPAPAQIRAHLNQHAKDIGMGDENKKDEKAGAMLQIVSEPGALEIEAAADGGAEGEGKGRLPRFKIVAYTGGPMRIALWRYPVVVDLAGLAIPSQTRPVRSHHDPASGVGHTDSIRIEDGKLLASGVVSRDTEAAREIVASAAKGFPWQASIGTSVDQFEFVDEKQTVTVNGREFKGPVNVVRKATLGEISIVDLGADDKTSAKVAATAHDQEKVPMKGNKKDPKTPAEDLNLDAGAPPNPGDIDAGDGDDEAGKTPEQIRAEAIVETHRIEAIRKVCGGKHADIQAKAISEGWDESRAELEVLRADRPKAPATPEADQPSAMVVLEAACALSAHLEAAEKAYDPQVLEIASRRFGRGVGLYELLVQAAIANGYTGSSFRNHREVLRFAFAQQIQAGVSTIDIGGILSNVASKFLLEGFFSVEKAWRNICAVRNVSDFKTVTSYRLIGKDQYEVVAPGGELKHGTLGNETYTNKADTYGLLLAIDRRDIINDDLGAVTTVPRKLGRGSGLKINDVFWTIFLNNSGFFKTANNNYLTGSDTALTIDGLTKAEVAFLEQIDSDKKPIGIMPAIILVPTALSAMATMLYKSLEIRDTTASTKYPVANPHQGKFRAEVSRYLANSSYTGHSSAAWYLLADPDDLPVIEVAFLNGQESPTIETAEADFSVLGVQMRGYHDFGVSLQDPKGGIKSKGTA